MPPVFPSGQFLTVACVQVRTVGATLSTAARRAPPSAREAADGYTCPPTPDGSPTGKHVIPGPQSPATGTGRSDTCVDRCRSWTFLEGATLATSSNRRKPECPGRHFLALLQTRKRVSGRFLV